MIVPMGVLICVSVVVVMVVQSDALPKLPALSNICRRPAKPFYVSSAFPLISCHEHPDSRRNRLHRLRRRGPARCRRPRRNRARPQSRTCPFETAGDRLAARRSIAHDETRGLGRYPQGTACRRQLRRRPAGRHVGRSGGHPGSGDAGALCCSKVLVAPAHCADIGKDGRSGRRPSLSRHEAPRRRGARGKRPALPHPAPCPRARPQCPWRLGAATGACRLSPGAATDPCRKPGRNTFGGRCGGSRVAGSLRRPSFKGYRSRRQ